MSTDASWVDTMPEIYDRVLGPALFQPFVDKVCEAGAALAPHRVLELAAGTGIATAGLLRSLPGAEVIATDLNPAMVSWGAEHVPGARWEQADAQQLGYPDASFDLVVCQFGVMFFPDKPAAFAEAARVLVPGGAMVLAVWDVVDGSPFPAAMMAALAAVLPQDCPDFIVRVPHGYAEPDRIRADLLAGGFAAVGLERVVLRGRAASARALAEGFSLGTPLRFALQERGDLDDLTAALGEQLTARLGDGSLEADLTAWVVTARR